MKLFRTASVLSLLLAVAACDMLKKKGADAGDEGGATGANSADTDAATTPPPSAGTAANVDDVARFPDETKINDVNATIKRGFNVRDSPPAGHLVAGVSPGQTVTEQASRGKYFLIVFDDAKSGKKLMGWVHADAFSAAPPDAGVLTCTNGEIPLQGDVQFCGKVCSADGDCPAGQACKGSAAKLKDGKAGDSVQVCTVYATPDAGSKLLTTVDAGQTAIDAGGGNLPTPTTDIVPAVNGKCPANFVLVRKDLKCHKMCPKNSDCRPGFRCGKCEGNQVCNDQPNFCPGG